MTDATKSESCKLREVAWGSMSSAGLEIEMVIHALEWLSDEIAQGDNSDPDILTLFIEGVIAKGVEAKDDVSDAMHFLRKARDAEE